MAAMLVARKQDKRDRCRIGVVREGNGEFKHLHSWCRQMSWSVYDRLITRSCISPIVIKEPFFFSFKEINLDLRPYEA